jgi:RNA polymerase sigma-70 factor (ECF subfamily)
MIAFLMAMLASQAARNEDDIRLLVRVKGRDQAALSELYDRYSSLVYTIVRRVVKASDEAEDLLQEVFMQIWNKASLFAQDKGSVYTWIVTIAKRKAIDRLRSKDIINKGESLDDEEKYIEIPDAAYMANPLHAAMTAEYEAILREGLDKLSVEQRTAIEMSYFDGYTQEQIAQRSNVPLGTVKTRQRQGLIKLRDILKSRVN